MRHFDNPGAKLANGMWAGLSVVKKYCVWDKMAAILQKHTVESLI